MSEVKKKRNWKKVFGITIVSIIVISLVVLQTCSFTVESGQVAVISTWGKFSPNIRKPGLCFYFPFMEIQKRYIVNTKIQVVNYTASPSGKVEDGVYNMPPLKATDIGNLEVLTELTVQYRITPEKAHEVLTNYKEQHFENGINPIIRELARNEIAKYSADKIAKSRKEISSKIKKAIQDKFETLPFTLIDVQLRNMELPPEVIERIKAVQGAKQMEEQLAVETLQEKQKAIKAEEKGKANLNKAKGDAKGLEAYTGVDPRILEYDIMRKFLEKWDGKLPEFLITGGSEKEMGKFILNLPKKTKDQLGK